MHWNERWRGWIVTPLRRRLRRPAQPALLADTITPYFETRLSAEDRERFALTYEVLNSWPVFVDPPKHTRLRRIFSRSFTPKTVQTMRGDRARSSSTEFLDGWQRGKRSTSSTTSAYPLPANVIATIIGAPREDLDRFHALVWG